MRDEKYLHQFLVLAEEKSFSVACQRLHLSQSALTKNIRKIEDRLDIKLFDRHPRGVELTEYGKVMEEHVRKMEKEYQFAMQKINSIKGDKTIRLCLGAGLVWGDSLLPKILTKFYKRYPEVEVILRGGDIADQLPHLINGKLDVVLGRMDYTFDQVDQLQSTKLIDVQHVIVVGKKHPLAQKEVVHPEDLVEYSWLLYHQTRDFMALLDNYFSEHDLPSPHFAMNSKFFDTAVTMVSEQNYLMCLPVQYKDKIDRDGLAILNIDSPLWHFPSGVWTHRNATEVREIEYFVDIAKELFLQQDT